MIARDRKMTEWAEMPAIRKGFFNRFSATRTCLGCIAGWDFYDLSASLFRFCPENHKEANPSRISYAFIQSPPGFPDAKFFYANYIGHLKQLIGYLKMEIAAHIGDFLVCFSKKQPGLTSTIRAFLFSGECPLSFLKKRLFLLEKTGIVNALSIAIDKKTLASHIDADCLSGFLKRPGWHIIARKKGKPLASDSSLYANGFYISPKWAMKNDFKAADFFNFKHLPRKFPASLLQSKRMIASERFKPGITRPGAVFYALKKTLKRLVHPFGHFLKCLGRHFFKFGKRLFQWWQLLNLIKAGDRFFMILPEHTPLLKAEIVKYATEIKNFIGGLFNGSIRIKAIFECFFHPYDNYFKQFTGKSQAQFIPGLKTGVFLRGREYIIMACLGVNFLTIAFLLFRNFPQPAIDAYHFPRRIQRPAFWAFPAFWQTIAVDGTYLGGVAALF